MSLTVSIETAVKRLGHVRFMQPIFEAITNALEANATTVTVIFAVESYTQPTFDGQEEIQFFKVGGATIEDNGDGYIEFNRNSFCEYMSNLKKDLGCKGVGRLTWLKVFTKVHVQSRFLENEVSKEVDFDWNDSFNKGSIEPHILNESLTENSTIVKFERVRTDFYQPKTATHVLKDMRADADLEVIRDEIKYHLFPKLFFLNKRSRYFKIRLRIADSLEELVIDNDSIPDLDEKKFSLVDNESSQEHDFILYHKILDDNNATCNNYYCANERAISKFDFKVKLPNRDSSIMYLTSEYFDAHDNDERNSLEIFPSQTDSFCPLSMDEINSQLQESVMTIVNERYPDLNCQNVDKLETLQEEYPYLAKYFDDKVGVGTIDTETIIKDAEKKYNREKEQIRKKYSRLLQKHGATKKDIQSYQAFIADTGAHSQQELAEYVCYRQYIINILKKFINDDEKSEAVFHNLIMKKYTEDAGFGIAENNLWLLDDRFTLYQYAASDKTISHILKKIGDITSEVKNEDRPDLALFFSENPEKTNSDLTSVIIELKAIGAKEKDKYGGVYQLVNYAEAFHVENPKMKVFWSYLITAITDELTKVLRSMHFSEILSTRGTIWYHNFGAECSIFLHVISASTIVYDADARNRTFLEIIKGKSAPKFALDDCEEEED